MKPVKQKTCKICDSKFTPFNTMQKVCGSNCALAWGRVKAAKKARARTRSQLEDIKTPSQRASDVQELFNQYIRLRDTKEPCVSCQRHHNGQYHAGHYLSVGSCRELRFNLWNVHKQCSACNNHLGGNIPRYRINLIKKIGLDKVEWLEGAHQLKKYRREDFDRMKKILKEKIKRTKKSLQLNE